MNHAKKIPILIILILSVQAVAQTADYVPGRMLIKTKSSKTLQTGAIVKQTLLKYNQKYHTKSQAIGAISNQSAGETYLITIPENQNPAQLAQQFAQDPEIEYAEPLYYVHVNTLPNDSRVDQQPYLLNTSLKHLFDITPSVDTTVAICDTGISKTHEDLENEIYLNPNERINEIDDDKNGYTDDISGYNFCEEGIGHGNTNIQDENSHGTHISGIIAAKRNNRIGVSGINPRAKILTCKFLNAQGSGNQLDAALSIYYAVQQGAKVINCSWGYYRYNTILKNAIDYALSQGVIIVAAAGNDGKAQPEYPAAFPGVLAVASIDLHDNPSYFSNSGNFISFATYGEQIYSTIPNGYGYKTGTSQSSAIVSGIASLIYSVNPLLNATEVKNILIQSCDDIKYPGKDIYTGYGSINGQKLAAILNGRITTQNSSPITTSVITPTLTNVMNFPNPASGSHTKFGFTTSETGNIQIKVFSLNGRLQRTLTDTATEGANTITFDLKDDSGHPLKNGTYFYVVAFTTDSGQKTQAKGKLSVLN
jgi:subtilisin family serine protease